MDERALLLLGLLKAQSQHGYQLHEFIELNLSRVTDMKKPTAYAILDRLNRGGYVDVRTEQPGNRPARKVYSITAAGEDLFQRLLREQLAATAQPTRMGDIGAMFVDELPRDEACSLLGQRLARLEEQIALYERTPPHGHGLGVDLAIERVLCQLRADRDWLRRALLRLAAGTGSAAGAGGAAR